MIITNNNKKNEKKENAAKAIARAKAWADRRRQKSRNSLVSLQAAEKKYEVNKVVEVDEERVTLLKSMLKKEKRILAETKLRIELIERELTLN